MWLNATITTAVAVMKFILYSTTLFIANNSKNGHNNNDT